MKENVMMNFEKELPRGYRVVKTIDAKSVGPAVIFNLLSVLIFLGIAVLAYLPLHANADAFWEALLGHYPVAAIGLLLGIGIYTVLHELTHGAAYRIRTHEKLTYGMSLSCAFCGVPHIFTYRKTALIAVLAPFVVFSALFLLALIVSFFISPVLYFVLALLFGLHVGGCSCDLYIAYLLLFRYREPTTLMNDTGPRMALLVYDEATLDAPDPAALALVAQMRLDRERAASSHK